MKDMYLVRIKRRSCEDHFFHSLSLSVSLLSVSLVMTHLTSSESSLSLFFPFFPFSIRLVLLTSCKEYCPFRVFYPVYLVVLSRFPNGKI